MAILRSLTVFLFLLYGSGLAQAQQKGLTNLGSAKGIVKDTVLNFALKSATVSVYNAAKQDSTLTSYQITNIYGEFSFYNLPTGKPLRLLVSNVGYQSLSKVFTLSVDTKSLDFGTLVLNQRSTLLKEVIISIPPISMNGDTLEFNADAFKLDTNAVVEDLLRKIPNVTLWGDGKITVNGRDVKSLLVNGKEFFGGDFKIATQNLAKNAVEKIQVYKRANETNPLDSTVEMNVKLKKGKDFGYFGKLGAGYGTDRRYEADGSLNAFNSKAQFSIVGAGNNINKIANDVRTLTNNSTFKGVGTRVEYRPDFRLSGINRSRAFGSNFTYNFIEKPTYNAKSTLSLNYFMQRRDNDNSSVSRTTTTTELAGRIFDESSNDRISYNSIKNFDSKYEWKKSVHSLIINQSFSRDNHENLNESTRSSLSAENIAVSNNYSNNTGSGTGTNLNFRINYIFGENFYKHRQRFKGLSINYSLSSDEDVSDRINITRFRSFLHPQTNLDYNRKYTTGNKDLNQQLSFELNRIKELVFGRAYLFGLDFSLGNEAALKRQNSSNEVQDFNGALVAYKANSYLSNAVRIITIEEMPFFKINKLVSRTLSNRYAKSLNIVASLKQKMIYQEHNSGKSFQNFSRSYSRFVPSANVSYTDNRYGEFNRVFSVEYNTSIQVPTLQQIAPLIDSTNIYNIQLGNVNLRESLTRSLTLSFRHEGESTKNTLNYYVNVTGGISENGITDSVFISEDNRRTTFLINSTGSKYLTSDASIRKAFKLKTSELQLSLNGTLSIHSRPGYLNEAFTFSRNVNTNTNLKFNFTYKGYLAFEGIQSYSTYRYTQQAFKTGYDGSNISTTLSSSYIVTKKLALSSNIAFNRSNASKSQAVDYTIWNAAVSYRFLKGNNLELKCSALDLLHQNKNVINYGTSNSFTIGSQNVLQHYFMTTVSYYPRQFGKKSQKK